MKKFKVTYKDGRTKREMIVFASDKFDAEDEFLDMVFSYTRIEKIEEI